MPGVRIGCKYTRKWRDEDMIAAVNAVKDGKLSYRAAGKRYGIPHQTIRDHLTGRSILGRRSGTPPILNKEEEEDLAQWCKEMAEEGDRRIKHVILDTVKKILDKEGRVTIFKDNRPGRDWWYLFRRRHPELEALMPIRKRPKKESPPKDSLEKKGKKRTKERERDGESERERPRKKRKKARKETEQSEGTEGQKRKLSAKNPTKKKKKVDKDLDRGEELEEESNRIEEIPRTTEDLVKKTSKKKSTKKKRVERKVWKCAKCSLVYTKNDESMWIGCDNCNRWYHLECVGLTEDEIFDDTEFSCDLC